MKRPIILIALLLSGTTWIGCKDQKAENQRLGAENQVLKTELEETKEKLKWTEKRRLLAVEHLNETELKLLEIETDLDFERVSSPGDLMKHYEQMMFDRLLNESRRSYKGSAFKKEDFIRHLSRIEKDWTRGKVTHYCSELKWLHAPMKEDEDTWFYFWSDGNWNYHYFGFFFKDGIVVRIYSGSGNRWEEHKERMKKYREEKKKDPEKNKKED